MTIYQISDCHLAENDSSTQNNLIQALTLIEKCGDGELLLLTGDLVCCPSSALYEQFMRIVQSNTSIEQIYAIAGNHDDLAMMKSVFNHSRIQLKDHIHLKNGVSVCFVDSSKNPLSNMPLGAGRVSNQAVSTLKKFTRRHQSIVVIHHPVLNVGAKWFTQIGIENNLDVIKAIHPQTIAVISGHAHAFFNQPIYRQSSHNQSNNKEFNHQGSHHKQASKQHKHTIPQIISPATSYGFEHANPAYEKNTNIGIMAYMLSAASSVGSGRYSLHETMIALNSNSL